MIDSMMMSKNLRNFGLTLTVTSALYSISAVSDPSQGTLHSPSYSLTQSLPALSAQKISADIQSRFDPLTGRTEYYAPDFDPFENTQGLAGSASLRSASSGISRDGVSLEGGAYVDVTVMYAAGSRDPYDSKGLEHAVFMNGQPIDVMRYDSQTLDCSRDTTKVVYDNSYYQGANYGYVGGVYRAYPRYRGHSQYGSYRDSIRYGAWRGLRHNYYGDRGYFNDRNNDQNYGQTDGRSSVNTTGSTLGSQVLSNVIRNRVNQFEDQVISSSNVIRPDRLGDRRLSTAATRGATRPVKAPIGQIRTPIKSPVTRSAPVRGEIVNPNRPTERRLTNSRSREDFARPAAPNVTRQPAAPRVQAAPNNWTSERTPARTAPTRTAPARTAPTRATRSKPKQTRPTKSRPTSRPKTSRSVDRAFGSRNKNTSRARRYYPGNTQTTTYVSEQCVKEERLTLHIPADRLVAAKFDGLSIAILDRNGQDVPLYLPPNYVEGFLIGNPYMRGATLSPGYKAPTYTLMRPSGH